MTPEEFLTARIKEDKRVAKDAIRSHVDLGDDADDIGAWETGHGPMDECRIEGTHMTIYDEGGHTAAQATHIALWDPHRVLIECEAKREMVGLLRADIVDPHNALRRQWAAQILRAMTLSHADHPDYTKVTYG